MAVSVPPADDVPATCGMLRALRIEVLDRIDHSKGELRAEMHQMKGELRAEMHQMKGELRAEMQTLNDRMSGVETELRGVKAEVSRIAFLVEEQNARNKVVLDALTTVLDRQTSLEQRVTAIEQANASR